MLLCCPGVLLAKCLVQPEVLLANSQAKNLVKTQDVLWAVPGGLQEALWDSRIPKGMRLVSVFWRIRDHIRKV
jgi:hypothetical protein